MSQNRKIKILLSSPHKGKVGGISRWTAHILRYYDSLKENSEVDLIQYYTEGKSSNQNINSLKRIYYGIERYIPYLRGLKHKLKHEQFDIVHFVSSASISLIRDIIAIRIAKRNGSKTIIHFRFGRIPELYRKKNWEQKLLHRVVSYSDRVIVIDKPSYDTLINHGYPNIELLPNPLAPKVNEIIENSKEIKRIDRKLLFAGHLNETKGIFELIEACKDIENINLKMIGFVSPDIREQLYERAGKNYGEWLEISGEQSYEKTIKEMLSAHIFVLPSYTEGFPNVILESMACGCPIIATNVGAIPEMLDIENGFNNGIVIEPKNVLELKEAIIKMLDDKEYAIQCGKNAQERVNSLYSMEKVWNQLEEIWKIKIQ